MQSNARNDTRSSTESTGARASDCASDTTRFNVEGVGLIDALGLLGDGGTLPDPSLLRLCRVDPFSEDGFTEVEIAGESDAGGFISRDARLQHTVAQGEGGTYYIVVDTGHADDDGGTYTLMVREDDAPDDRSARPVTGGAEVGEPPLKIVGTIEVNTDRGNEEGSYPAGILHGDDQDVFGIELRQGRTYFFSVDGHDEDGMDPIADPRLVGLYDWRANWMSYRADGGGLVSSGADDDPDSMTFTAGETATYFIGVGSAPRTHGDIGAYELMVEDVTDTM